MIQVSISWGFQKDSPYIKIFNYHINNLRESGTIDKILFEGEVNGQVCRSGNGQYYAIRFTNILSAFVALCFGIGKVQNLIKIEIVFENKFDF